MLAPDIARLPGDEWSIRAAAAALRSTVSELRTAKTAALHVEAICDGQHWRGEAFDVFRASVDRKPLPAAIDHAADRMDHGAGALEVYAGRFAANARTIEWCRSRLHGLGLAPGVEVPDELVAEVVGIARDADRAWDEHHAALRTVRDTFDWLDDEPTFAEPPPSNFERVTGFAGDVVIGFGEAAWDLMELNLQLQLLTNPVTGPRQVGELWDARDEIADVVEYAWEEPDDFVVSVGESLVDADTWREDGVGRWIGHRIPDVLVTVATGGTATAPAIVRRFPRLFEHVDLLTKVNVPVTVARDVSDDASSWDTVRRCPGPQPSS